MRNITEIETAARDHLDVVALLEPIRVFILAGIRLYRESLAQALAADETIQVVGTGPVDEESLRSTAAAGPSVVLMDAGVIREPDIMQAVSAGAPDAPVIALGLSDPNHEVIQYAEAGVAGYVPCEGTVSDVGKAIRGVSQGEFPCSPKVAALLVKRMSSLAAGRWPVHSGPELSSREAEIMTLIGEGMWNKEIASRLGIEVSTVKNHVHHILAKLGVTRRGQAAARLRTTLVPARVGTRI